MQTIDQPCTPCIRCNEIHAGAQLGHAYTPKEGVGYIRLCADTGFEFCWRCSCHKSGWVNVPNDVSDHCANEQCLCHTAERAH